MSSLRDLGLSGRAVSIDMLSLRDKNRSDCTKNKPCETTKILLKQVIDIPVMYNKRIYLLLNFPVGQIIYVNHWDDISFENIIVKRYIIKTL
jgi:hypothetical protein